MNKSPNPTPNPPKDLHPCIVQINCQELINFLDLKLVQIPRFCGLHLVVVRFQGVDGYPWGLCWLHRVGARFQEIDGFPWGQLSDGGT